MIAGGAHAEGVAFTRPMTLFRPLIVSTLGPFPAADGGTSAPAHDALESVITLGGIRTMPDSVPGAWRTPFRSIPESSGITSECCPS
jgi:hypothetical protein